jgi:hypothetical protein
LQPQSQTPLCATPIAPVQPELFPCDDAALMAQYLAESYPALQPTRVMTMQPPANREEMVYPSTSPVEGPNVAALGIQGQPHLMGPTEPSNPVSDPYSAEVQSPPFGRHASFVGLSPRYSHMAGYDIKDDPEDLDLHGRSGALDLYPHPRTLPARRGPFKDFDQRERTARTRKMGSCIRCRMQRIRVRVIPIAIAVARQALSDLNVDL